MLAISPAAGSTACVNLIVAVLLASLPLRGIPPPLQFHLSTYTLLPFFLPPLSLVFYSRSFYAAGSSSGFAKMDNKSATMAGDSDGERPFSMRLREAVFNVFMQVRPRPPAQAHARPYACVKLLDDVYSDA